MADAPVTTSKLDGFYKEVYGSDVPDLIPRDMMLQKEIKFQGGGSRLGKTFNQPVRLADSSGFTFAGADAGAFTLKDARALTLKNASVGGSQVLLREQMDYETAFRAVESKAAFKSATKYMFEGMLKSHRKINEINMLYGQSGIGEVDSEASGVITLDLAKFAAGIWGGLEGAVIDIFSSTVAVKRGDSLVITAVDVENRTISYTGTYTSPTAGDLIFFEDAAAVTAVYNEQIGIHKILNNTGSLFGIDASVYSLWKATQHAAGSAALTQAILNSAIAKAVNKGLNDEVLLVISTKTWTNLLDDQSALRRHVEKEVKGKFVNGAEKIEFYAQNGVIKIVPSIYCWEGFAYGLCLAEWKRIGATDVTMQTPGMEEGRMFHQLPTAAGFEVRSYSNQAVFCHAPAKNFIITGIVNA